ncbi:MAG: dihydrolipoyl dehydrogenase family protein, partial [Thermomicrobium sp.]
MDLPTATDNPPEGADSAPHRQRVLLGNASQAFDTDLLIIGGGSAGFAAAIEARQLGARVVMVEKGTLGGTCVNVGCVPSKFFLRAAELAHLAATHPYHGIETSLAAVDLAILRSQQRALVTALRAEKYEALVDYYGWELIRGTARFLDPETVVVNQLRIRPRAILLATGARPAIPPLPGLLDVPFLTSTSALDLEQLPRSLVILGAGFVALELGQAFHRLGTAVTLVQRRPQLLPEVEPELAEALQHALATEGLRFLLGTHVQRIDRTPSGIRLLMTRGEHEEVLETEAMLVATGRVPNTDALNLSPAQIAVDERGAPIIDATLRTTNPRVYAAGDVVLTPQFVYVAAAAGRIAARNALLGENRPFDLSTVPAVLFTDPQLATVGLTRAQARAAGHRLLTCFAPAAAIARERVNFQPHGGVLVLADRESGRLLGVQAVAS